MEGNSIETSEGRFEVVFKQLRELQTEAEGDSVQPAEASIREREGIDELRRLSAEVAEVPTVSYTTT